MRYARDIGIAANGAPALTGAAVSKTTAALAPAPLTAEEALLQAEAEGLTLQPSDNTRPASRAANPGPTRPRCGEAARRRRLATSPPPRRPPYTRDVVANGHSDDQPRAVRRVLPATHTYTRTRVFRLPFADRPTHRQAACTAGPPTTRRAPPPKPTPSRTPHSWR